MDLAMMNATVTFQLEAAYCFGYQRPGAVDSLAYRL
jgi:hypothetical protein